MEAKKTDKHGEPILSPRELHELYFTLAANDDELSHLFLKGDREEDVLASFTKYLNGARDIDNQLSDDEVRGLLDIGREQHLSRQYGGE